MIIKMRALDVVWMSVFPDKVTSWNLALRWLVLVLADGVSGRWLGSGNADFMIVIRRLLLEVQQDGSWGRCSGPVLTEKTISIGIHVSSHLLDPRKPGLCLQMEPLDRAWSPVETCGPSQLEFYMDQHQPSLAVALCAASTCQQQASLRVIWFCCGQSRS